MFVIIRKFFLLLDWSAHGSVISVPRVDNGQTAAVRGGLEGGSSEWPPALLLCIPLAAETKKRHNHATRGSHPVVARPRLVPLRLVWRQCAPTLASGARRVARPTPLPPPSSHPVPPSLPSPTAASISLLLGTAPLPGRTPSPPASPRLPGDGHPFPPRPPVSQRPRSRRRWGGRPACRGCRCGRRPRGDRGRRLAGWRRSTHFPLPRRQRVVVAPCHCDGGDSPPPAAPPPRDSHAGCLSSRGVTAGARTPAAAATPGGAARAGTSAGTSTTGVGRRRRWRRRRRPPGVGATPWLATDADAHRRRGPASPGWAGRHPRSRRSCRRRRSRRWRGVGVPHAVAVGGVGRLRLFIRPACGRRLSGGGG